jgi:hypothetical protein
MLVSGSVCGYSQLHFTNVGGVSTEPFWNELALCGYHVCVEFLGHEHDQCLVDIDSHILNLWPDADA